MTESKPPRTPQPRTSRPTPANAEIELSFQPINPGLGFHPFSDGLPYAPVSKSGLAGGSGAVSAGPPRISTPRMPTTGAATQARTQIPASRPGTTGTGATAAGHAMPVRPGTMPPRGPNPAARTPAARTLAGDPLRAQVQAGAHNSRMLAGAIPESATVKPDASAGTEPYIQAQERYGFGYLFKRVFAYSIDTLLNLSLCIGAFLIALWKLDINPMQALSPMILLGGVLFLALFNWALITAQEIAFGATVGKRLFGLSLQGGGAATVFIRAFFFFISVGFGGLGLIWALFDRRRRCWHDLIVDLQPMEIARL